MVDYVRAELDFPSVEQLAQLSCVAEKIETGEIQEEVRYFITSQPIDLLPPEQMLMRIHEHWSIENSLHHVLDRSWNEDKQRTSSRRQGLNLKLLRQMALNLLRQLFGDEPSRSMPILALTFLFHIHQFLA